MTEKESKQLIQRLEAYVSRYQAAQMNRQVYVSGHPKSRNEKNYYRVNDIQWEILEEFNGLDEEVVRRILPILKGVVLSEKERKGNN